MIKALKVTNMPAPIFEDVIPSWCSGKDTAADKVVYTYHETIFHANDTSPRGWQDDQGRRELRSKGSGIMYSDFIEEYNGFLCLTDD